MVGLSLNALDGLWRRPEFWLTVYILTISLLEFVSSFSIYVLLRLSLSDYVSARLLASVSLLVLVSIALMSFARFNWQRSAAHYVSRLWLIGCNYHIDISWCGSNVPITLLVVYPGSIFRYYVVILVWGLISLPAI